jgi:hypothetical protein
MRKEYLVRDWLKLLPPEVSRLAPANLDNPDRKHPTYCPELRVHTLSDAINMHATWSQTPQGGGFWQKQYDLARQNTRTPKELMGIDCTVPE